MDRPRSEILFPRRAGQRAAHLAVMSADEEREEIHLRTTERLEEAREWMGRVESVGRRNSNRFDPR